MGIRYRKSKNIGPFRITASKSGVSTSIGVKGFRVTKTANGRTRMTMSIPGTGIGYVKDFSGTKSQSRNTCTQNRQSPQFPYVHSNASFYIFVIIAAYSFLSGIIVMFPRNVDEPRSWFAGIFSGIVFALIALAIKRRNEKEKAAYDKAVSAHIAKQQEKEAAEKERIKTYERQKAARKAEHDKYLWASYPVAGVTFRNSDGTSRQRILKDICMGDEYGSSSAWLEQYEYQGENAIRVITDEGTVGNIQRRHVSELLPLFDNAPDIMRVDAELFENDEGKKIYRADLVLGLLKERVIKEET